MLRPFNNVYFDCKQVADMRVSYSEVLWLVNKPHLKQMIVNDTKYDLCKCGHQRYDHKRITGISAAVRTNDTHTCNKCDCNTFSLDAKYLDRKMI
jgi:acetone carboxylase gamma subunit